MCRETGALRETFAVESHSVRLEWGADLYSDFGVRRNLRDLCFSKPSESFSGTGPRLRLRKRPPITHKPALL